MFGCIIKNGPSNWQIIQQQNGHATVELGGEYFLRPQDRREQLRVCVHVYDEHDRSDVIEPVFAQPQSNGTWQATLTLPVGGPYTITTFLRWGERDTHRGDSIFHVGVGDVYVIAGQSNSWGTSKDGIEDEICQNVHVFRLCGKWDLATHPLSDTTNVIIDELYDECAFHSPWIAFARQISQKTGYPIGLIPAAKGGTPLSFWQQDVDGRLMNAMLKMVSLSGSKVRGVLWYQGCNDCDQNNSVTYLQRFKQVCASFRQHLGKDLAILTVQLNKQTYIPQDNSRYYATVREAQRQAALQIPNVFVAPALDLPVCDTIHNCAYSNLVIARRLANVALKHLYGKSVVCDFPDVSHAEQIDQNSVRVFFNNVLDALTTDYVHVETSVFQVEDDLGVADLEQLNYNGDNSLTLVFDRALGTNAKLGCTRFTDLGTLPYDVATRLPALAFCDLKIMQK